MKTLTTPVATNAAASQSGWCEVYDFYLAASIVTPFGTTNVLRLTTLPGGISFFTPQIAPEPSGTQGGAQDYVYWPITREVVKGDAKYQDDKLVISASNVTAEWATMLGLVKWYDTPVVIRKVPLFQTGLTADDCAIVFSGLVDSVTVTAMTLQITCSSSMGALSYQLPNENMHASCRFRFGDDMCAVMKYLPENYQTGTCDSGSSTSNIKSAAGFTADTGASSGYGTDIVDALANNKITASSALSSPLANTACTFAIGNSYKCYFYNSLANGAKVIFSGATMPSIFYKINGVGLGVHGTLVAGRSYTVLFATGSYVWIGGPESANWVIAFTSNPAGVTVSGISQPPSNGLNNVSCTINTGTNVVQIASHGQDNDTVVTFAGTTLPSPLVLGYAYYIVNATTNDFQVAATIGGSPITLTTPGTAVKCTSLSIQGPFGVKASNLSGWLFTTLADWGTNVQGYWQIASGQTGLKNAALKPYIQFDFSSAVTPRLWRLSSFDGAPASRRVRLVEFFSSSDASTWNFESYFELPNQPGVLFDCVIPKASNKRYWRICVRSRWGESFSFYLLQQISAYTGSRNWWANGQITFDGNVTAALAGLTRSVVTSYSGEINIAPLPVAPAAGDTFTIQRGCGRSFNACCQRLNTENYGGFNDLALQNLVNFAPR